MTYATTLDEVLALRSENEKLRLQLEKLKQDPRVYLCDDELLIEWGSPPKVIISIDDDKQGGWGYTIKRDGAYWPGKFKLWNEAVEEIREALTDEDTRKIVCHASGDRCLGCSHYQGKSDICEFAVTDDHGAEK